MTGVCVEGKGGKVVAAHSGLDADDVYVTITMAYPDGTCKQITLSSQAADSLGRALVRMSSMVEVKID